MRTQGMDPQGHAVMKELVSLQWDMIYKSVYIYI
jgi:hypothetical protein